MSFWSGGKCGGPRPGGSRRCGNLSCFPSGTNTHQDFSLHLLDSRSRELQRGQRELPSGQSLHFSPYTLPRPHSLAASLRKKQARTRDNSGKAGSWEGEQRLWEKSFVAQLSCRTIRLWKKHVEGERINFPNFFHSSVTIISIQWWESQGVLSSEFSKCKYKLPFSGKTGTSVLWLGS